MPRIDRRRFLLASAATAALPSLKAFAQTQPTATLTLHPDKPGAVVPPNFIGLSYETQQLTDPSFFSAANAGLIAQFKALAPNGVLRLGGNTSDHGWWKPTPETPQPAIQIRPGHDAAYKAHPAFPVTPEAVRNLRAFLDRTGWTCLYGINLGTNTPERAAEEAAFVHGTLGDKLEYFQLGNEPDGFSSYLRDPKTWSADTYFDQWLAEARAVQARVPTARFGIPDVGWSVDWITTMAKRLLATPNPPTVVALSHHHYIGGPPSNPKMTIPFILQPDPRVLKRAAIAHAASAKLLVDGQKPVPYRMTEGNTCYGGGKPGVSDVFAASLWAADYLLLLASLGYAGVNFHGGDGKMVANSLGGKLPGDEIVLAQHDDPNRHPHPYYTPIAHIADNYIAEPVFYGMKFASAFAGAKMIPMDFDPGEVNATAYAAGPPEGMRGGSTLLAIINKDAIRDLTVALPDHDNAPQMTLRLTAPALSSDKVELRSAMGKSTASITVPRSSAALVQRFYK